MTIITKLATPRTLGLGQGQGQGLEPQGQGTWPRTNITDNRVEYIGPTCYTSLHNYYTHTGRTNNTTLNQHYTGWAKK